uniref:Uncharacterized protein n=1 Tax=Anguilla anguilla TaxID=7936 RepID=A0A0E9UPR3_ANGAN
MDCTSLCTFTSIHTQFQIFALWAKKYTGKLVVCSLFLIVNVTSLYLRLR